MLLTMPQRCPACTHGSTAGYCDLQQKFRFEDVSSIKNCWALWLGLTPKPRWRRHCHCCSCRMHQIVTEAFEKNTKVNLSGWILLEITVHFAKQSAICRSRIAWHKSWWPHMSHASHVSASNQTSWILLKFASFASWSDYFRFLHNSSNSVSLTLVPGH